MTSVTDSGLRPTKKKSLLDKFDVPVYHLDFDYVKKCTDVKELEKIIKILRSKQEGYYPELEACAENQLAALDSRNRLLRHTTKVMTKADLSKEEWNNITTDLLNWKGGVEDKDLEILETKSRTSNGALPNIRNSSKGFRNKKKSDIASDAPQRISSLDYKSWEKFDADEECKKMDLEEEQKQSAENRKNNSEAAKIKETASIEEVAVETLGDISHLSVNEKEVMAVREKDIGNEFYNTNKVDDAIKHYTRSIHLHPTVVGLNNRAAAYIKQCAFNKALDDLNKVLEMDPKNIKARFRRAQSFQHKNMFREALEDISEVLIREPNHLVARHIADQLRESVAKLPKMHKIKIKDKESRKIITKTVTEAEMLNEYKNENFIEVNDWGLPKIMCNCNGKHSNEPGIRHEDHIRYQHLNRPPTKKIETVEKLETPPPEKYAPIPLPGKKLEILEVEKGIQESENYTKEDNVCVVADMRTVKSANTENIAKIEITGELDDEIPPDTEKVAGKIQNSPPLDSNSSDIDSSRNSEDKTGRESGTSSVGVSPGVKSERQPDKGGEMCQKTQNGKQRSRGKKHFNGKSPKNREDSPKSQKTDRNTILKDISDYKSSRKDGADKPSIPDKVKDEKTETNWRIQDNNVMNGHDNRSPQQPCGCSEVFTQFQFKKEWALLTGPRSLERKAKLLKSICPKHMVNAFGNSWEKEMLVDVFECLHHHFNPSEKQRVAGYLSVVPKLDRFKINAMFLTTDEKSLARELVENCSAHLDSNVVSAFS